MATLAVVAVLACFLLVGYGLHWIVGAPLLVGLAIGAIVAPTDTAAVLNIFRDIGAPRRLSTIVEGESLFNDAVAIALVVVVLAAATPGAQAGVLDGVAEFLRALLGGLVVGVALGGGAAYLVPLARGFVVTEITVTVALAYLSFVAGQWLYGVSGIVAVVAAAMTFGNIARTRLTPGTWESLTAQWQQLDFWATTLIFVFAAMRAPDVLATLRLEDLGAVVAVFAAAWASRAIVVHGGLPLLSALRLSEPVSLPYQAVLTWGGVRGAVTVALAILVAENAAIEAMPGEQDRLILAMGVGYALLTILLNGPTLRPLMRAMRLHVLDPRERLVRDRVLALSQDRVARETATAAESLGLDCAAPTALAGARPEAAAAELSVAERVQVGLFALVSREAELAMGYLRRGLIDRPIAETMLAHASRMFEFVRARRADGYREASRLNHRPTWRFSTAMWVHRRFGAKGPLAAEIATRIETMLAKDRLLDELIRFARADLSAVVGADAFAEIETMLADRRRAVQVVQSALERQYPDYARVVRLRLVERIGLAIEENEYRAQRGQSLISEEVYEALEADRRARLAALSRRPELDLGLEIGRMIAKVPLFRAVSEANVAKIAKLLRPQLAVQNERVIQKGAIGREMYFIVSGVVDVMVEPSPVRLKDGDFFGEVSLVTSRPRNADVIAESYCELLVLRKRDFDALVAATPELKAQIDEAAAARTG